jgi:hypothetical protein
MRVACAIVVRAVDGENHSATDGKLLTADSTFAIDRAQE